MCGKKSTNVVVILYWGENMQPDLFFFLFLLWIPYIVYTNRSYFSLDVRRTSSTYMCIYSRRTYICSISSEGYEHIIHRRQEKKKKNKTRITTIYHSILLGLCGRKYLSLVRLGFFQAILFSGCCNNTNGKYYPR
jgi:hypothetical protein